MTYPRALEGQDGVYAAQALARLAKPRFDLKGLQPGQCVLDPRQRAWSHLDQLAECSVPRFHLVRIQALQDRCKVRLGRRRARAGRQEEEERRGPHE